jgi:hypothetical protein
MVVLRILIVTFCVDFLVSLTEEHKDLPPGLLAALPA